jgi:hypothetical protein
MLRETSEELLKGGASESGGNTVFGGGARTGTSPSMEVMTCRVNVKGRDPQGWTPCSIAAFHGQKEVLRVLLRHGGDPTVSNKHGKNAFDVVRTDTDLLGAVLRQGNPELEEILIGTSHTSVSIFVLVKYSSIKCRCDFRLGFNSRSLFFHR